MYIFYIRSKNAITNGSGGGEEGCRVLCGGGRGSPVPILREGRGVRASGQCPLATFHVKALYHVLFNYTIRVHVLYIHACLCVSC